MIAKIAACLFITALFKIARNEEQFKHQTIEVSSININVVSIIVDLMG